MHVQNYKKAERNIQSALKIHCGFVKKTTCFSPPICLNRTEFQAYKDVKPVKPIKAPSQYKPPLEETNLETSYSATFKGEQVKPHPFDNKSLERRRIRSLYSEPGKEPAKVRIVPPAPYELLSYINPNAF